LNRAAERLYPVRAMKKRTARVDRKTRETDISIQLNVDGEGRYRISTGIPFLNHMLELLAKHACLDVVVRAKGDLDVDYHHTVEDVGLALGEALNKALGDRKGITRYGWCVLPMDDALSRVALDLGGRPYLVYEVATRKKKIRDFDLGLIKEFFQAFTVQARMNLHIKLMYGEEPHHAYEAVFKALARALRMAMERDPRVKDVPSSKGKI
jgi:imidazoleglycerol-phosphate dehydratase